MEKGENSLFPGKLQAHINSFISHSFSDEVEMAVVGMNGSFPDQALMHKSCREAVIETRSPTPAPPIIGFSHPELVAGAAF